METLRDRSVAPNPNYEPAKALPHKIRIFLADGHSLVREGLKLFLDRELDFEVVGEADTAAGVIAQLARKPTDVIVVDTSMPDMRTLVSSQQARRLAPSVPIVVLTQHSNETSLHLMLRAGVQGYVLKRSSPEELLRAIRAAATGEMYVDAALTHHLASSLAPPRMRGLRELSAREVQVLRLAATGHANTAIAVQLALSIKTIELHKANAMQKLDLQSRAALVRYALNNGWLHDA
jgi:DNA-binding NarL/FixJ family response regulator